MPKKENAEKKQARPADRFCREMTVLYGFSGMQIYGCRKILLYSPENIRLAYGKKVLSVTGTRLCCTAFTAGCIAIEGRISGIRFLLPDPKETGKKGSFEG